MAESAGGRCPEPRKNGRLSQRSSWPDFMDSPGDEYENLKNYDEFRNQRTSALRGMYGRPWRRKKVLLFRDQ